MHIERFIFVIKIIFNIYNLIRTSYFLYVKFCKRIFYYDIIKKGGGFLEFKYYMLASIIGYLFGCVQTAYILIRIVKKEDIRKLGTNNAGASNVTTVAGWKLGIITAVVDILKGTAAVYIVSQFFPKSIELLYVTGAFVILGHIFPAYLKFKGGKGTASLIGIMLAINFKIALILVVTLVILTVITDYIAIGSIGMFSMLPAVTFIYDYKLICIMIGIFLLAVCIYKHFINLKRIFKKEELGLRAVIKRRNETA